MTNKNTLVLHGCGGCGVNIVYQLGNQLKTYKEGFANIKQLYLDASDKNIINRENIPTENVYIVSEPGTGVVDGSGGSKKTNYSNIIVSVPEYLEKYKIIKRKIGEFHIVIYSASGGTGSIAGPILVKALLDRGIPVISVVVGDTFTPHSADNTLKTLVSIQNIVKASKKPICSFYIDNNKIEEEQLNTRIEHANGAIFIFLLAMSVFLSGENVSLDNQDMITFFDYTQLSGVRFKPAFLAIEILIGDNPPKENVLPIIGRTLTKEGVSPDINAKLSHWKSGIITKDEAKTMMGEQLPFHLVLTSGYIENEIKYILEYVKKAKEEMAIVDTMNDIDEIDDGELTDDGMLL